MYPLELLCKQYTNQSVSEISLEGSSPFLPALPGGPLRWLDPKRGLQGSPMGDRRASAVLLWSHAAVTPSQGQAVRPAPRAALRAGLQPPSWVSLLSFKAGLSSPSLSIQEATCIPSTSPHPPVPRSPRDPHPHPPPLSHPRTQTNDRITNPGSTDMFTRMTYALTKSKWERDQGRAAKDPGGFRAARRWLTLDPQQSISRPARSPPSSALDCGGPVHPVWRESTQWAP